MSLIAVNHDCTDWTNLFSAELVVGSRRIGTIDGGWTTTHIDSQRNGFLYFLATRTVLMRHFRMTSHAAVAMDSNTNSKSHKFFCFCVEGFRCRGCQPAL